MSPRRILRIVLSLAVITLLWSRTSAQWHDRAGLWLVGSVILSAVLLLVVILDVSGVQRKWRRMRDEVPKKPLGLD